MTASAFVPPASMNKTCRKCERSQPMDFFNKDKSRGDGVAVYCNTCRGEMGRLRHLRIPHLVSWRNMVGRCYNIACKDYHNYGARGISVCQAWRESYEAYRDFRISLGDYPGSNLSIDRIDNDGNYCPENCRLATALTQSQNQRLRRNANLIRSGHFNVTWKTSIKRWTVEIKRNGVRSYVGCFVEIDDAIVARDQWLAIHDKRDPHAIAI